MRLLMRLRRSFYSYHHRGVGHIIPSLVHNWVLIGPIVCKTWIGSYNLRISDCSGKFWSEDSIYQSLSITYAFFLVVLAFLIISWDLEGMLSMHFTAESLAFPYFQNLEKVRVLTFSMNVWILHLFSILLCFSVVILFLLHYETKVSDRKIFWGGFLQTP